LGRKDPIELMDKLVAEEETKWVRSGRALPAPGASYDPQTAKAALRKKIANKHGLGGAR
jgi:hypothetical protein